MKKLTLALFVLGVLSAKAGTLMEINSQKINLDTFKKEQGDNIKNLGADMAIDTYIDVLLLEQYAKDKGIEDNIDVQKRIYTTLDNKGLEEGSDKYNKELKDLQTRAYIDYAISNIETRYLFDDKAIKEYIKQKDLKWGPRIEGDVYFCSNEEIATRVAKDVKAGKSKDDIIAGYKDDSKKLGEEAVFVSTGKFTESSLNYASAKKKYNNIYLSSKGKYTYVINYKKNVKDNKYTVEEVRKYGKKDYLAEMLAKEISNIKNSAKININQEEKNKL